MISDEDIKTLIESCRAVPRTDSQYVATDYVSALLDTVLDFQMRTVTVRRAIKHFNENRWDEVRTVGDLKNLLICHRDNKEGNTDLAQYLWGYNLWTRAHMLRDLVEFFDTRGIDDIDKLRAWAATSDFGQDFEGHIKGLGPTVYRWLVMRLGVETVKPDVHIRRFTEGSLGRTLSDDEIVEVVSAAARELGMRTYELDWSIWEYQTANSA